ncbi:ADP-ribosylglycohydrolase family protein [Olleya sp. Bg11-27]|uniref:ADP-ribosylglycohydrolase family protein n=1 Tax=Olleya sp. Bg11-27 TaxID=2058135 RepID=UPI000C303520|nr:ADP-ribosylglycohydrolase family protein [Olleya sp. Bg11-27]AUC76281.1 ADP-ribosylglycohydrolase family protein [Olleya sp. Bg11-27]
MDIESLLLGTAIGDAFGAGVEFQDRDWISKHVNFKAFVNARNKIKVPSDKLKLFTENYTAWDYTDDTEMTIGVIHALLSSEPFTEVLLVKKWQEEYDKGIQLKGFGRNGHGSMRWYYSKEKTIEEVRDFQRHRINPGNAPAMRAVPLGLINEKLINHYSEINANATHPNENAIISSQCISHAAHYLLIKNNDPKKIIDYCLEKVKVNSEYSEYLNEVNLIDIEKPLTENDYSILCGAQPITAPYFLPGIKGVPSDSKFTAGCVLYVLKISTSPFDALKHSVKLGGDVDSIASITTGILAGKMGLSSIPQFMLDNVEGVPYLKTIAKQFKKIIS